MREGVFQLMCLVEFCEENIIKLIRCANFWSGTQKALSMLRKDVDL